VIRFSENLDRELPPPGVAPSGTRRTQRVRIFESNVMEMATRVHPCMPLCFIPVLAVTLGVSLWQLGAAETWPLFAAGWLGFSLIEYLVHRFLFHGLMTGARSPTARRWAFALHGHHHRFPDDTHRLVMPPLVSWLIAGMLASVEIAVLGTHRAAPLFAGTLAGYLALFASHYYVHRFRPRRGPGRWLRIYHLRHHHQDSGSRFGVSSPIWDVLLGTFGTWKRVSLGKDGCTLGNGQHTRTSPTAR
jgi:sterol desaturase/sphingolipid hydroxylase (fatty acid hydroxylase superfamily)